MSEQDYNTKRDQIFNKFEPQLKEISDLNSHYIKKLEILDNPDQQFDRKVMEKLQQDESTARKQMDDELLKLQRNYESGQK